MQRPLHLLDVRLRVVASVDDVIEKFTRAFDSGGFHFVLQLTSFPPPRSFTWRTSRRDAVRQAREAACSLE